VLVELGFIANAPPPAYHQQDRCGPVNDIQMLWSKMDFDSVFTRLDVMEVLTQRPEIQRAQIAAATTVLANLNQVVSSPDLTNALASGRQALEEIRRLSVTLQARADPLADRAEVALGEAADTLRDLRQTSVGLRDLLAPHAGLSVELATAMDDLRQAARAVTELAEFLTRNPNALISGRERTARPR
jgi:paraquat-inducible protein B